MCMYKKKFKKISGILIAQLCALSVLSGCAETEADADKLVIVEQDPTVIEYKLAVAAIDDVVQSKSLSCEYTQLHKEDISFAVSGKQISRVYVKEGDDVKKGQLLAELSSGNRESEIKQLEYQIARNKILLEQLDENENYEISNRWLNFMYGYSYGSAESLKEGIANMQRNNQYTREDYQDAIALDETQLNQLKAEAAQGRVYATMNGTVTSIENNLEGKTSTKDEVIMTIMDNSECLFTVDNMDYLDYFAEGKEVDMTISYGTGSGTYKLIPYEMDKWEENMKFVIAEGGETAVIEPGTIGSMQVILAEKKQVLTLPTAAIHSADDKHYVYVVGENNMREVKWIEVGLAGKDKVEIVSGLVEGEKVILK